MWYVCVCGVPMRLLKRPVLATGQGGGAGEGEGTGENRLEEHVSLGRHIATATRRTIKNW